MSPFKGTRLQKFTICIDCSVLKPRIDVTNFLARLILMNCAFSMNRRQIWLLKMIMCCAVACSLVWNHFLHKMNGFGGFKIMVRGEKCCFGDPPLTFDVRCIVVGFNFCSTYNCTSDTWLPQYLLTAYKKLDKIPSFHSL